LLTIHQRSIPFDAIARDRRERLVNGQLFYVEPIQPASQLGQLNTEHLFLYKVVFKETE
jgi:hypothetical protein